MTTQHTKGPWHIGEGNGDGSIFADSGRVRGTTLYPIAQVSRGWNATEDDANARLIASAPDLLDALRDLVSVTTPTYDNRHELAAAIDAIERATGEAA